MVGIAGLLVALAAMFGISVDPDQQVILVEILLFLTSITAIAVQPKEPEGTYDRDYSGIERRGDDLVGVDNVLYKEERQNQGAVETKTYPSRSDERDP